MHELLTASPQSEEERQKMINDAFVTGSLILISIVVLGYMFYYLGFVLIPLIFANFLVYVFRPVTHRLTGRRRLPYFYTRVFLPQWVAVAAVLVMITLLLCFVALIIAFTIAEVLSQANEYLSELNLLSVHIIQFAAELGYSEDSVIKLLPVAQLGTIGLDVLDWMFHLIPKLGLVLIIVIYMLLEDEEIIPRHHYDPSDYQGLSLRQIRKMKAKEEEEKRLRQASKLRRGLELRIRNYLVIHGSVALLVALLEAFVLLIFEVKLAMFFGFVTFLLNWIPNVGAIAAALIPLPFIVLDPASPWWHFVLVGAILMTIQLVLVRGVEPKVLGHFLDISPISVILALVIWGKVWGIGGAIMSLPLTIGIKLYLESIDHPAPQAFAAVIAGRFSLIDMSAYMKPKSEPTPASKENNEDRPPIPKAEEGEMPANHTQ